MQQYTVVKNEGVSNLLVWKYPNETFNVHTQLIVRESEEAVFVRNGEISEIFSCGDYKLDTNHTRFQTLLRKLFSGGTSYFNCKIYFVSKVHKLEIFWGTDSPIPMRDAEFGFAVGIRARGSYSVQIKDPSKFLIKLVGNGDVVTTAGVEACFRSAFVMHIKTTLAQHMNSMKMTVLDMAATLQNNSEIMKQKMQPVFDEYGLELINFYIVDISIPENDPNYEKINSAYSNRAARNIEGYNWQQEQSSKIFQDLAKNEGVGALAAKDAAKSFGGVACDAFCGMGNDIFGSPQERVNNFNSKSDGAVFCCMCGAKNEKGSKFCNSCGAEITFPTLLCPSCNAELKPNSKFCNVCGTKLV